MKQGLCVSFCTPWYSGTIFSLLSLWQMLEKKDLKAGVNRYASTHICNPNAPATEGRGTQVPEVHNEFQASLCNMRPHLKNKTYFVHGFRDFSTWSADPCYRSGEAEGYSRSKSHLIAVRKQRQTGRGHTYPSKTRPEPGSVLPPTRHHLLIACSFSYELINGFTH